MACEIRSDLSSCLSFLGPFGVEVVVDFLVPFSFLTGVFLLDFLVVVAAFFFFLDVAAEAAVVVDFVFFFLGGEGDEA